VPKRLAGRIKRRFSGKTGKVKERELQDDSPMEEERDDRKDREGRHKVSPYVVVRNDRHGLKTIPSRIPQLKTENRELKTVLEIDRHRPDRIIFTGKEVKVTTIGFSLIYLLAQHRGEVVSYEVILKELWEDETDAIYTRINQHIYKFRKDILDVIGNSKTNKEKIKDRFRVVSGRGVMLNINDTEIKIN